MKTQTKKVADYWNMRGKTYSRSWTSVAKQRLSTMETDLVGQTIQEIEKQRKGPVKTLDVGIAIGRISEEILKHDVELYGTDISQKMVEICQEKFKGNKKVKKFVLHDVHNPIPVSWGKFDVITAIRVIAYSPRWQKELYNIYEAMKPGSILVFTFPNKYSSHVISTRIIRRHLDGVTASVGKLQKALQNIGFSNIQITGYSRLLDIMYDWADSKTSSDLLFLIEKLLGKILGPTFFARLFYVVCQK